ncbi:GntR family transcriptional regulator [Paenalcaligenes hominis]|uniref:GntR family transcriptional regulator n=1 Tax=Paenalcaligenes hominis TaxID=643674 RepID=A0A1U9K0R2_9BURK|nr:GntR family transcriptional regulator [Paenalcaligenes hominis]AQS51574.1 GntR family transcriptional regulator [Paenalcaligenes hominis]NJB65329.1 DNA-binding GntR family transcriptional regulator [Paenalcaligenes hominis]GGE72770.1 GntR family transcriptional regulator [Paenalcaligenes hominis]
MMNTSVIKLGQKHAPLFTVVRDRIREDILNGVYRPGDRLIEGKLSEDLGVSRIPIREALRELSAEGIVTIEPRRGASVAVLSDHQAKNLAEVRAALEGLNARLAAMRRDEATIDALKDILQRGQDALAKEDLAELKQLNTLFHEHLGTMAQNHVLTELTNSFRDRTTLLFAPSNIQRVRNNWEEHAQILNAVIAGNAELANLLATQHVHNAAAAYFETKEK